LQGWFGVEVDFRSEFLERSGLEKGRELFETQKAPIKHQKTTYSPRIVVIYNLRGRVKQVIVDSEMVLI